MDFGIFDNPVFICLFLTGVIVWLVSFYILKNPPKSPNRIYGYRTRRAKASQEAWDYAQVHGATRLLRGAQIMVLLSIVSLFFNFRVEIGTTIVLFVITFTIIIPIHLVEKELKEKFG